MADIIRVESSDLQQCAAEYAASLSTLQEAVTQFTSAVQSLSTDWSGMAFAIMLPNVLSLTGKIAGSFERVLDAVSELGEVSELFQETEEKIKGKFENADVGTKSPFEG